MTFLTSSRMSHELLGLPVPLRPFWFSAFRTNMANLAKGSLFLPASPQAGRAVGLAGVVSHGGVLSVLESRHWQWALDLLRKLQRDKAGKSFEPNGKQRQASAPGHARSWTTNYASILAWHVAYNMVTHLWARLGFVALVRRSKTGRGVGR